MDSGFDPRKFPKLTASANLQSRGNFLSCWMACCNVNALGPTSLRESVPIWLSSNSNVFSIVSSWICRILSSSSADSFALPLPECLAMVPALRLCASWRASFTSGLLHFVPCLLDLGPQFFFLRAGASGHRVGFLGLGLQEI